MKEEGGEMSGMLKSNSWLTVQNVKRVSSFIIHHSSFLLILALFIIHHSSFITPISASPLTIEPGALARFEIVAPAEIRAGDPTRVRITARDASGNAVTSFDRTGGGVSLALQPGGLGVEPAQVPASAFRDGVFEADLVFTRAGVFEFEVTEARGRVSSRTGRIDVRPGAPSAIRIVPPASARVGDPFDVLIELFDRHGNAIVDFDRSGAELLIRTGLADAGGQFEPSRLAASLFARGRATARVRYTRAERTALTVEVLGARATSPAFDVRAGALHAFHVSAPSRSVMAGEPFTLVVEARDAGGNVIADFDRVGEVVELRATGTGNLEPSSIPPTAFVGGVATVTARYNIAEKIGVVAADRSGARRGESADRIDVVGGRLGRFEVLPAENARAGEKLAVQIIGHDVFGNIIRDYSTRRLRVVIAAADGAALEATPLGAENFRDGVAFTTVTPVRAGSLVVQVVDEMTGAGGRSRPLAVRAGVVSSYGVRAPQTAAAHEPFEVEVVAVDRFGNVIRDYDRSGAALVVDRTGLGEVTPSAIAPSAFVEGVARVRFAYNRAEEIALTLMEQGGTARGRSNPVVVTHADVGRFEIEAPARITAGEPTRLTIRALDDFGNPVVAYAASGRTVSLVAEQGDPIAPPVIASALFRRGVAEIDVVFFRTGEAVLVAEEIGGRRAPGPVAGKSSLLRIVPGRPAHLAVSAPSRVEAGVPADIRIEMQDRIGNRIRDYSPPAASLSLRVIDANQAPAAGALELGAIRNMLFREGVAEIRVLPKRTGEVRLEVTDEMLGISGRSTPVRIVSGPVDRFTVERLGQDAPRAGEPMKLRVTALDAFENVVDSFGEDGAGVRLLPRLVTASGPLAATGSLLPSMIRGAAFRQGRAEIYAIYDRAEEVEIQVERAAPGVMIRPEVVAIVVGERAGGSVISVIGNSPLKRGEVRRLTESLYEMVVPGAVLPTSGMEAVRASGLASLVTVSQAEEGVRILVHATGPAALRAGEDGNRLVMDLHPAATAGIEPMVAVAAMPLPSAAPVGPGEPLRLPTMADVDRLVRQNRFVEALALIRVMVNANPGDASLLGLQRRLEMLAGLVPGAVSSPPSQSLPMPVIPALHERPTAVENPATGESSGRLGMADVEIAVRGGRYRDALRILEGILAANPQDVAAMTMKRRIEQMITILERGR